MPPLPLFILATVILAWVLAAISLLVRRRRHRGSAWHAADAALPHLSADLVAWRIGAVEDRPAAMAAADAIATEPPEAPAGAVESVGGLDREPAAWRRQRLWRDAAAVLLVSSLAVLAIMTFDPKPFPSRAGTDPGLLAAAATASPPPPGSPGPSPSSAAATASSPAPTLVPTTARTPRPAPTPAVPTAAGVLAAADDAITVLAVGPARVDVLANDRAGAGRSLTVTAVTQGAKGRVTTDGTSVTYDPAGCALGADRFRYTVSDGVASVTRSVLVTISRPGRDGFPATPVTDTPRVGFIPGSTVGSTVPMRLSWCGVVATTLGGYTVVRSSDGGTSWSSPIYPMTTLTGSTRAVAPDVSYAWGVRTTDASGRSSGYAVSLPSRVSRIEDADVSLVRYAGPWQTATSAGYSGGTERYAFSPTATATVVVSDARAFAIVSSEVGTRGSFRVFVDGAQVAVVSERTPSVLLRRVVYVRSLAAGVRHTMVIQPDGNGRVDLDAILTLQ
jgi:hypothetical protein